MDRVKELVESLRAISPLPDEEDSAMTDELIKQYCDLVKELEVIFKQRGVGPADAWIIAPLISSFSTDTAFGCAWTVRRLLERFLPTILRPELRRGLESGKRGARVWCAYLLGVQRDPADVPVLVAGLHDPEEEVRLNCVTALGMIGDHSAIPAMEELLKDPSAEVRKEASSAIGSIVSGRPQS
jgi:hypothetical protein